MNNMSTPGHPKLFDCIWLVKPLADYYMSHKTHLLVRVEQLSNLGINCFATFLDGDSKLLLRRKWNVSGYSPGLNVSIAIGGESNQ